MRKLNSLVVLAGLAVGCGSSSTGGTPSGNGVTPGAGFIGRTVTVQVSGDETTFADSSVLDFGAGVTVANVVAASPTLLLADVTIDPTAAPGKHDVTVTTGGQMLTLKTAFELKVPGSVSFGGNAAQGSVVPFTIINHDFDNPFDTTATGDGLFTPFVFTNLAISGPTGIKFTISDAQSFKITGSAQIDVDAAAGPVTIASGPAGMEVMSPAGNAAVVTRSSTTLTSAVINGMVTNPYDSSLYDITTTGAPAFVSIPTTASDMNARFQTLVMTDPGHFDGVVGAGIQRTNMIRRSAGKLYVIAEDLSGFAPFTTTIKGTATTLSGGTVLEGANDTTNNVAATGQQLTLPALFDSASLSSLTDQDWVKFTVAAGDIGKHIRVVTMAGDARADTVVQVFGPTNSATAFGTASDDNFYHEDWTSPAIVTAGTYFVKVTMSSFTTTYSATSSHYNMVVLIE